MALIHEAWGKRYRSEKYSPSPEDTASHLAKGAGSDVGWRRGGGAAKRGGALRGIVQREGGLWQTWGTVLQRTSGMLWSLDSALSCGVQAPIAAV